MTEYMIEKEKARNMAVEWQNDFYNHNYSYDELAYWQEYFERLGQIYDLTEEFKENGII